MLIVLICHKQHYNRHPLLSCHKQWDPSFWLVLPFVLFVEVSWPYVIPCWALALLVHMFVSLPFHATLECKQCTSQYVVHNSSSSRETQLVDCCTCWSSRLSVPFFTPLVRFPLIRRLDLPGETPFFQKPALTFFISILYLSFLFVYLFFYNCTVTTSTRDAIEKFRKKWGRVKFSVLRWTRLLIGVNGEGLGIGSIKKRADRRWLQYFIITTVRQFLQGR